MEEEKTDTDVLIRVKKTPRGDQRRAKYSTSGSLDKQLGQKHLTGLLFLFVPSSPKTLSAVTHELLHSTVMPEIYDAWSDNMMEPHPILEAMFAGESVQFRPRTNDLTFHDFSIRHTCTIKHQINPYMQPLRFSTQTVKT